MSGQNTEIVKLQIRRGPESKLPTLDAGEPAITTDTNKIFVGDGTTNHELAHKADLDATNVQLAEKAQQSDLDQRGYNVLLRGGAIADANYINNNQVYSNSGYTTLATDNTSVIQNAINTNTNVYISKGNYLVSALTINSGTHIKGDGIGKTILYVVGNITALTLKSNIVLEDISIIQVNSTQQGNGSSITGQSFITLNRVQIKGFSYGVYGQKTVYLSFTDCQITNNGSNLYLYGSAGQWNTDWFNNVVTVTRGQFVGATNYGIYIKGSNVQLNTPDVSGCLTGISLLGDSTTYPSPANAIIEPYAENTQTVFSFSYAYVHITGGIVLGGASPYAAVLNISNYSDVHVKNLRTINSWTNTYILTNNSSLKLDDFYTQTGVSSVDATSIVINPMYSVKPFSAQTMSTILTTTAQYTPFTNVANLGTIATGYLYVYAIGSSKAVRLYQITWDGTTLTQTQVSNANPGVVTVSGTLQMSGSNLQARIFSSGASDGTTITMSAQFIGIFA